MESRLEFENGQEMKTNGPVLCVEDLRLAAHRRLPLPASASKKKSKNGGKAEATMEGKRSERVGEGTRARGRGLGAGVGTGGAEPRWRGAAVGGTPASFHRRTLGPIYGFRGTNPLPRPPREVEVTEKRSKRWGIEGIRIGTSDSFGQANLA